MLDGVYNIINSAVHYARQISNIVNCPQTAAGRDLNSRQPRSGGMF
jgi:hypothetical protein